MTKDGKNGIMLIKKDYTMWKKINKEGRNMNEQCFVSFRNNKVITLNSNLCKRLSITKSDFAEVFIDESTNNFRIEFSKHRKSGDSYTLSTDGGGRDRKTTSLVIQAPSVFKSSRRLSEISKKKKNVERRVIPSKVFNDFIEFYIIPNFELDSKTDSLTSEDTGIYQLIKDNEVVYIGKGLIKQRVASHKRAGLDFDNFKFSLLKDDKECLMLESYYINEYNKIYGKLPLYNNIKGIKYE